MSEMRKMIEMNAEAPSCCGVLAMAFGWVMLRIATGTKGSAGDEEGGVRSAYS